MPILSHHLAVLDPPLSSATEACFEVWIDDGFFSDLPHHPDHLRQNLFSARHRILLSRMNDLGQGVSKAIDIRTLKLPCIDQIGLRPWAHVGQTQ